jgi:CBS domain-containing protein
MAHGLPVEGDKADAPTAARLAHDDVITCALDDPVEAVRARVERSPYGFALVVSEGRIVLGRLRADALRNPSGGAVAETVMEPGPSTVRADTPAADLAKRLAERDLGFAIVTTPEGRLIGVVRREDLEAAAS